MWSGSGGRELVSDLNRKASSFSLLGKMLAVRFFIDVLYQVKEIPLYSSFAESFIVNGCWILSNAFSVSIYMII